jgi:hypothetical protein
MQSDLASQIKKKSPVAELRPAIFFSVYSKRRNYCAPVRLPLAPELEPVFLSIEPELPPELLPLWRCMQSWRARGSVSCAH